MGVLEDLDRERVFYIFSSDVYDRVNPFVWNAAMREGAFNWVEVYPDAPRNPLFRALDDAVMLFYDAGETDQISGRLASRTYHRVLEARPGSFRAIVTLVSVPQ